MTGALLTNLFRAGAAVLSMWNSLKRKNGPVKSPFRLVQIEELAEKLPSPLRALPRRIARDFHSPTNPGTHLFVGSSGVGKTREALEYIKYIAPLLGVRTVYLANGYVEDGAPLPEDMELRNVIVLIDDYDLGFPAASAASFADREAGNAVAMANLRSLHLRFKGRTDLQALVVTINSDRLPMEKPELAQIFPEASVWVLPPITLPESRQFIEASCKILGLRPTEEALAFLASASDGKFDILATFLSRFKSSDAIGMEEVAKYDLVRHAKWEIFRSIFSEDQQLVYDQVKLLHDFGLPARSAYVVGLLHLRGKVPTQTEVLNLLKSIWPIDRDKAVTYDGQFGPPQINQAGAVRVTRAVLLMAGLRTRDRYGFQREMKPFGSLLVQMPMLNDYLRFFRCLRKWYPQDRYFAYLLAVAYRAAGRHFRAVFTLFRVFRAWDARSLHSGKWIQIQCHLLLAQLYQDKSKHHKRDWEYHLRLEHEFETAANLADLGMPDIKPHDFEVVYSSRPDDDGQEVFAQDHKELGYEIPPGLSVESKRLRAMVHHRYSAYLLSQLHREFDAIRHEEIVLGLLPKFGEAFLNCAIASLQIGDSARALQFLDKASVTGPTYLDTIAFEFFLSRDRWRANEDLGNLDIAQQQLKRCVELVQMEPLREKSELAKSILLAADDKKRQAAVTLVTSIRKKVFCPDLEYKISALPLNLVLPGEWKVASEWYAGDVHKPMLAAIFSSQVIWDKISKSPNDASLDIRFSMLDDDLTLTAEKFGIGELERMRLTEGRRLEWSLDRDDQKIEPARFCRWNYVVKGSLLKTGAIMAFALPKARFSLRYMCEDRARHLFWEQLLLTSSSVINQLMQ